MPSNDPPKKEYHIPPGDRGRPHPVKTNETLVSIARANGISEAELNLYNFGTIKPREVNWYLKNRLRCTKETPDGNNWMFTTGQKSGIVYLPPPAGQVVLDRATLDSLERAAGFPYTTGDLRRELIKKHGSKLTFLFDEMDKKKNLAFAVENLYADDHRRFRGTKSGAYVDVGADLATATDWALDALREWAGSAITTDFADISREWAKRGEIGNSISPASSLGTTLDWVFLFSRASSSSPTTAMYPLDRHQKEDQKQQDKTNLFDLYCWIFTNLWDPTKGHNRAKVNIENGFDMHPKYLDSKRPLEDQTHHFAAYFWLGAVYGSDPGVLQIATVATKDRTWWGKDVNSGDVELGRVALKWGEYMQRRPAYIGSRIAASLRFATGGP